MRILITGGCGFLGSNLAANALRKGHELCVFDNLSRLGSIDNLEWLKKQGDFSFNHGDIRNPDDITGLIKKYKPEIIFHLAGQVAMTTSIENPRRDFETNALGTFNVLEAVRNYSSDSGLIFSSTNKVYGNLEQYTYEELETRYRCIEHPKGFDEQVPLDFHSPYGCSKGTADQYVLDYHRIFGLKTAVFRHSSMYGGRQFATYDQGWVGWFCQKAVEIKKGLLKEPFSISGNGKQVRDMLHAEDMVSLYYSAAERIEKIKGNAFNIGGGLENSLSLLELFSVLEKELGISMRYRQLAARISDQKFFVADTRKAQDMLGWEPKIDYHSGVLRALQWIKAYHGNQ